MRRVSLVKEVVANLEFYLLEAVLKPGFVAFVDYFGRFSTPKLGAIYLCRYCPPIIWIENRLNQVLVQLHSP